MATPLSLWKPSLAAPWVQMTPMPADVIVQATKQLTDALKGNFPTPLVPSGIDQLKTLTNIFDETAEACSEQENDNNENTVAMFVSPKQQPASPTLRVEPQAQTTNVPTLRTANTSTAAPPWLVVESTAKSSTLTTWFPNYITQDEDDAPALNTSSRALI